MKVVLAAGFSYMATTHNFLSKTHFKGWRGLYIEIAIHHLLEKIYAVWNENKIASFLMEDVSTPYPNTSH